MTSSSNRLRELVNLVSDSTELEIRYGKFNGNTFVPGITQEDFKVINSLNLFNDNIDNSKNLIMFNNNKSPRIRRIITLNNENRKTSEIFEEKNRIDNINIPSKNIRISLSSEKIIKRKAGDVTDSQYNFFRLKSRVSRYTKDGNWRFDFSNVQQKYIDIDTKLTEWLNNALQGDNQDSVRELEIEYIGDTDNTDIIKSIGKYIDILDKELNNERFTQLQTDIISNIQNLFSDKSLYNNNQIKNKLPSAVNFKSNLTNNSTTLLAKNIGDIEKEYAVSPKADGERVLLYINFNGEVYIINSRSQVTDTRCSYETAECYNSLIDCEYINETLYAFDVLIFNSKDLTEFDDLRDRIKYLKSVEKTLECNDRMYKIKQKYIDLSSSNVFQRSRKVLDKKYEFETDGLVFTPINRNYRDGKIYKWKPPNLLTTDFLIKLLDDNIHTDNSGRNYKKVYLFVGISRSVFNSRKLKHLKGYKKMFPKIKSNAVYFPTHFSTKSNPDLYIVNLLTDNKGNILSSEDTPIKLEDNTIVEFAYISKNKTCFNFVPFRNRLDRTEEYLKRNNIFGNSWWVAESNYDAMIHPITEKMISGEDIVKCDYYNDIDSDIIKEMKKFHGVIKKNVYNNFIKKDSTLLELGGGRYNDMHKWIENGLNTVVVVDTDSAALKTGHKRLLSMKKSKKVPNVLHINDSMTLHDLDKEINNLKLPFKQFDNIICNFAIHYANDSEEMWMNFINNVNTLLKPGGNFIYSTMNGRLLFNKLNDIQMGESISLYKSNGKSKEKIFELTKRYTDNDIKPYGQKIDIYVQSIGTRNKENLADITYINKSFMDLGYKVIENFNFEEKYNKKYNLSDAEKEFSFLNHVVVLKKK